MSDEPPTLAPQDVWRAKEEMQLEDEDLMRIVNVGRTVTVVEGSDAEQVVVL